MSTTFTIGDLAKATDTKVVTIRYYETAGLMPAPTRTEGNYRSYRHEHIQRLHFIRRCRALGFSLAQIQELLRLSSDEKRDCAEVDRITAGHLHEIEEKIADLNRLAEELRRIGRSCHGNRTIADCQIIEALSPDHSARK